MRSFEMEFGALTRHVWSCRKPLRTVVSGKDGFAMVVATQRAQLHTARGVGDAVKGGVAGVVVNKSEVEAVRRVALRRTVRRGLGILGIF